MANGGIFDIDSASFRTSHVHRLKFNTTMPICSTNLTASIFCATASRTMNRYVLPENNRKSARCTFSMPTKICINFLCGWVLTAILCSTDLTMYNRFATGSMRCNLMKKTGGRSVREWHSRIQFKAPDGMLRVADGKQHHSDALSAEDITLLAKHYLCNRASKILENKYE